MGRRSCFGPNAGLEKVCSFICDDNPSSLAILYVCYCQGAIPNDHFDIHIRKSGGISCM